MSSTRKPFAVRRRKTIILGQKRKPSTTAVVKKEIKKAAEKKYKQFTITGNFNNGGSLHDLSNILPGTSKAGERVGDRIDITSIKFGYSFFGNVTTPNPYGVLRMLILQWHDDSAAGAPNLSDILINGTAPYNLFCGYRQQIKSTFTVLYDKVHTTSLQGNLIAIKHQQLVGGRKFKKIEYNAAAVTGVGKVYAYFVTDAAAGVNEPVINFSSTLRYVDL